MSDVDPQQLQSACGAEASWLCERVLDLTGSEGAAKIADWLVDKPLKILVIVAVAAIVAMSVRRAIRHFVKSVTARAQSSNFLTSSDTSVRIAARAQTLGSVLRSAASVAIWGLACLTILGELGINLGPLIAGAGIVGVAVGFGAQSLVKDFLSGLFMLIEDQYGVGDTIDVGEVTGAVEGVTLRTTRLRDVNGAVWYVPNGEIRRVANKSQQWARGVLDLALAHGTDLGRAAAVVDAVAAELTADEVLAPRIIEAPRLLGVEDVTPLGVVVRLVTKTDPAGQLDVMRELRARVTRAFEAEGVKLAPPPPAGAAPSSSTSSSGRKP